MREISVSELNGYIDPWKMERDWAVAIASDGRETNGLTIGWAGFGVLWNKPMVTVYVHAARYSKHIFDGAEFFSVCFLKPRDRAVLEYFGRVSGRDEDKMKNCALPVVTGDKAPYLAGSRVVLLCRVMGKSDFDPEQCDPGVTRWYKREGVHTQYYGEIVRALVCDAGED